MLNLLKKDYLLLKRNLWIMILYSFMMFFIFSRTDMNAQMIYVMGITMISYLLVMYSTAYDNMNKSDTLLNSLPLKRRDIVAERYMSLFVFIAMSSILMALSGLAMRLTGFFPDIRPISLFDFVIATWSICLVVFLYLPVYFKVGYLKAKLVNFAIFFAVFMIPTIIGKLFIKGEAPLWIRNLNSATELQTTLFMALFITIAGIVSYSFSLRFYKNREF